MGSAAPCPGALSNRCERTSNACRAALSEGNSIHLKANFCFRGSSSPRGALPRSHSPTLAFFKTAQWGCCCGGSCCCGNGSCCCDSRGVERWEWLRTLALDPLNIEVRVFLMLRPVGFRESPFLILVPSFSTRDRPPIDFISAGGAGAACGAAAGGPPDEERPKTPDMSEEESEYS